jgi:hypothetical protein
MLYHATDDVILRLFYDRHDLVSACHIRIMDMVRAPEIHLRRTQGY